MRQVKSGILFIVDQSYTRNATKNENRTEKNSVFDSSARPIHPTLGLKSAKIAEYKLKKKPKPKSTA